MTRSGTLARPRSAFLAAQIERWRYAAAYALETSAWLTGGGFVAAFLLQIALLAHSLTLTE